MRRTAGGLVIPETRYATAVDGGSVAYQVFGTGRARVLVAPGGMSGVDVWWDWPAMHRFWERYGEFATVAWYDKRGTGSSERMPEPPSFEQRTLDVDAVADTLGWDRFNLIANSEGGAVAMLYAASRPDRVERLVLQGTFARLAFAEDYPIGIAPDLFDMFVDAWTGPWGTTDSITGTMFMPSQAAEPGFQEFISRAERATGTPGLQRRMMAHMLDVDVREVLPSISCPTLVMHATNDLVVPVQQGRYLAEHIAGATIFEYEGEHFPFYVGVDQQLDTLARFLTGAPPPAAVDRVLASVVFTDIVDSTRRASGLGDAAWRALLDRHDAALASVIALHRGRLVNTTGDGLLATFDSPTQAVRAARGMLAAASPLDLQLRAGVHTGEVERRGDDIAGIAVHIAARISSLAAAGEVLVSGSLPPLVVGSELAFHARGDHELKGVPGTWPVLAAI